MLLSSSEKKIIETCSNNYPYPIASACQTYLTALPEDPWESWELLSRSILQAVLHYLSHMLLSDLIALGEKPSHIYHHIQAVLSRPMAGQYVGFLRETARYYQQQQLESSMPELIDFLIASEVACTKLDNNQALIGQLVEYRNAFAHGKVVNQGNVEKTAAEVMRLTLILLEEIQFLRLYPLCLEDGTNLMGHEPVGLVKKAQPLQVVIAHKITLRPLLLKLEGRDLVLLEDVDPAKPQMDYRGVRSYHRFTKKQLQKGNPALILEALKESLSRVRSVEAILPRPYWDDFAERVDLVSQRTYDEYVGTQKYDPSLYIPSENWEGSEGRFNDFLNSHKSLLAMSGGQGSGKSALAAHMAQKCREAGHAVLFFNAQRLTYADVKWTENPLPAFLANLLRYDSGLDAAAMKRLAKQTPQDKKIVIFLDAINEVDSIRNKWNPFRALEEILSWACASAHPSLKFVISFRLDLYEEFDVLQEQNLPDNLLEVSFFGNNSNHSWVHDLEAFGPIQAEKLYKRLQQMPERCMAPSMRWSFIRSEMGEDFNPYLRNPLLFKIFLQAHHLSDKILEKNQDQLFIVYADHLTGAAELRLKPLWKKISGFIKNGNTTLKERFLVDCIQRMAKNGSSAFLIDQLTPKNKQDKRILNFLSRTDDNDLKDLLEGGLLDVENIEHRTDQKEVTARRVAFVGELLTTALNGVEERLSKYLAFRQAVFIGLGVLFFLLFMTFLGYSLMLQRALGLGMLEAMQLFGKIVNDAILSTFCSVHEGQIKHLQNSYHLQSEIMAINSIYMQVLLGYILSLSFDVFLLYLIWPLFETPIKTTPKNLGLLIYGAYKYEANISLRNLIRINLIILPAPLFFVFISYFLPVGSIPYSVALAPSLSVMLFYIFIMFSPVAHSYLRFKDPAPFKLRKKMYQKILELYKSQESTNIRKENNKRLAIILLLILVLPNMYHFFFGLLPTKPTPEAFSAQKLELYRSIFEVPHKLYSQQKKDDFLFLLISIILVVGVILLNWMRNNLRKKTFKHLFATISVFPKSRSLTPMVVGSLCLQAVFLSLAWSNHHYQPLHWIFENSKDEMEKCEPPIDLCYTQNGLIDLRGQYITPIQADYIARNSNRINKLLLPNQESLRLNLENTKISVIGSRPESLMNLEKMRPPLNSSSLILYHPENWFQSLPKESEYHFKRLTLQGKVLDLSGLQTFPWLQTLSIEEQYAATALPTMPQMWNNLEIIIASKNHPKLDWITPELAQYVIHLKNPPIDKTKNLEILNRVIINGDGLDLNVLTRLKNAKWVMLIISRQPTTCWYQHLYDLLKSDLQNLQNFGIAVFDWQEDPLSEKHEGGLLYLDRGENGGYIEDTPTEFLEVLKPCLKNQESKCWLNSPFD